MKKLVLIISSLIFGSSMLFSLPISTMYVQKDITTKMDIEFVQKDVTGKLEVYNFVQKDVTVK